MSTNYHTPIAVAAPVNTAIVNAPLGTLDAQITANAAAIVTANTNLSNIKDGTDQFTQLRLNTPTTLTISGGAVTISRNLHRIDTEGAASTDQLDTLNGGVAGDWVRIQSVNAARVVEVRHQGGGGNIYLSAGVSLFLTDPNEFIDLVYDATAARWIQETTPILVSEHLTSVATGAVHLTLPQKVVLTSGHGTANNKPFLALLPRPDARAFIMEKAAAATYEALGMAAGTNAGAGAVTAANQTDSVYVNQAIGAVAATFGGRRSTTFNLTRRQYNPYFAVLMRTSTDITNIRFWIGLAQAQVTNVDALAAATAFAGFRYSTVAGDPAWMAVCADSSGAAQTNLSTGVGVAVSTAYLLELFVVDGSAQVFFSVNRSTPVVISTNLPPAGTELGWTVSAITTTATAKNILISRVYCDFN